MDYLRISAHVALRWGASGPGEWTLLGYRLPFPNQTHAFFLLHELFVNLAYAFDVDSATPRIVDCGANIGMSILFFKLWAPGSSIIAVEPDTAAFQYLQTLVTVNRLQGVQLVNAAIARDRGFAALYTMPGEAAGITSSLHSAWGGTEHTTVATIPLSDLITGAVDFLKLDVEGVEYDAIDDLESTNRLGAIREIALECHDLNGSDPRMRLVGQLERAGLHVSTISQDSRATVLHASRDGESRDQTTGI